MLALMCLPLFALAFLPSPLMFEDRLLIGAMWALCFYPALHYLRLPPSRRPPVPFFPFIGLEFALYYALQGVVGRTNVYGRFDVQRLGFTLTADMYSQPIMLLLIGWVLLLVGYYLVGGMVSSAPKLRRREWATEDLARWGFRILVFGIAIEMLQRMLGNPMVIRGMLYFGGTLSLLALSLLTILSVRRQLTHSQRIAFYVAAAILIFFRAGTSATAQLVIVTLTIMFSVWIGGGRLSARWIWTGVAAAMLFVSVRGVANEHRKMEVSVGAGEQAPMLERSTAIFGLLVDRVETDGVAGTVIGGWETVAARAALLDLFTDVVRQTPATVPYWEGATYLSLIGAVVPRFLWPDKPVKITGYLFGQRYHYLRQGDFTTTINMPYLVEFYANFGVMGVYLGMLLVGVIYRLVERVVNVPGQSLLRTVVGIGILLPLINIESDFSVVFGGLFLTGAALYVVYRVAGAAIAKRRLPVAPGGSGAAREIPEGTALRSR